MKRAVLPRLVKTMFGYHPDPDGKLTWWKDAQDALDEANSRIKRLVFSNRDAVRHTYVIECTAESAEHIIAWYGFFHSGDRYTVTMDGKNVKLDKNGEMK